MRGLAALAVAAAVPACPDEQTAASEDRVAPPIAPPAAPPVAAATRFVALDAYHAAPAITGDLPTTSTAMPGRIAAMDARRPVPRLVWTRPDAPPVARGASLTGAPTRSRIEAAALWQLTRYAPMYGLDAAALGTVEIAHVHDTGRGAIVVDLRQRVDGLEVWRSGMSVVMDRQLRAVALTGNLHGKARPSRTGAPVLALGADDAVVRTLADIGGPSSAAALTRPALTRGAVEHGFQLIAGPALHHPARARAVWFPLPDRLVPAWLVETVPTDGSKHPAGYLHVVAGDDGRVLLRHSIDAADSYKYRVWADADGAHIPADGPIADVTPYPGGVPDGRSPAFVAPTDVTMEGFNVHGDPWLPAGATETRGNNIDAYADLATPDHFGPGDLRASTTAPGEFLRTYVTNQDPQADDDQIQAAVTQLFYTTNWLHDYFYDSGFTEAAGNAQADNRGRGGVGGDVLLAEAQDSSGTDNANMQTPIDGRSPIMQMYVFTEASDEDFKRDGTIDNHIVAHEWGHYLHHRLVLCGENACGAMSEGWGDFLSLLMAVRPGDNLDGPYGMGVYATRAFLADHAYFGIRRYPYSVDFTKNALTFRHVADRADLPVGVPSSGGGNNWEVHNAGEVWASVMFEGLVALLKDSRGPGARFTFEEARRRMTDYVVAGMIAAPVEPNFTEQRDAILAAAAASDPADLAVLAAAFARRGMGARAASPAPGSPDGNEVIDDFTVAGVLTLDDVTVTESAPGCDGDGVLDPGETGVVTVRILNTGALPLAAASVRVTSSLAGLSFPEGPTATFPATAPFATSTATVPVALGIRAGEDLVATFDVELTAAGAVPVAATVKVPVNLDERPATSARDDVESPSSAWTTDGRLWERKRSDTASAVWHLDDVAGPFDASLVSPALTVSPTAPLVVSFRNRYQFAVAFIGKVDGGVLEVSTDDGATWRDAGELTATGYDGTISAEAVTALDGRQAWTEESAGYPGFRVRTINFANRFAGETIRLRFRAVGAGWVSAFGWDLDDITITGITNTPFATVALDDATCLPGERPLASAGPDQTVAPGDAVELDGGASSDPDGSPLTMQWTQVSGTPVTLTSATTATPGFVAPLTSITRTLTFRLTVHDADERTGTDTVAITVEPPRGPVDGAIDAGADVPDAGADEPDAGADVPDAGGEEPDAGADVLDAAPRPDAGLPAVAGDDGCGCQSSGDGNGAAAVMLGGLGLGLALRRRRRV